MGISYRERLLIEERAQREALKQPAVVEPIKQEVKEVIPTIKTIQKELKVTVKKKAKK